MPLKRLQTLLSQESLKIGNAYYDEDLISAIPLLKPAPPEILACIPQISGNPRQLGRFVPLERLLDRSYKEWYIQQYCCFHESVDDNVLF